MTVLDDLCAELEARGWRLNSPCPTRRGDWRTYTGDDGFVRIQPAHVDNEGLAVPARLCVRAVRWEDGQPKRGFALIEDDDQTVMVEQVRKTLGWPALEPVGGVR